MAGQNLVTNPGTPAFSATTRFGPPVFFFVSGIVFPTPPVVAPVILPTLNYIQQYTTTANDYGEDILVFPDLDGTLTETSGDVVLADAIARRFLTQRGSLEFYPDYGTDVRDYLNESIDANALNRIKAACEQEAVKDERVLDSNVTVKYNPATFSLTLLVELQTKDGPYDFTLLVTQLTATLLETA